MKKFLVNACVMLAAVAGFTSCEGSEEPTEEEVYSFELSLKDSDAEAGTRTYQGKDSDGDYLTMVIDVNNETYDLYYGESKRDENTQTFSKGTYTLEASITGDNIMKCTDEDATTTFSVTVEKDGKKISYTNAGK